MLSNACSVEHVRIMWRLLLSDDISKHVETVGTINGGGGGGEDRWWWWKATFLVVTYGSLQTIQTYHITFRAHLHYRVTLFYRSWTVQGRTFRPDNPSFSGHTEWAVNSQRRSRSENICKVCLFCSQDSEPSRLRRSLRDVQENVLRKYVNDISLHHELH